MAAMRSLAPGMPRGLVADRFAAGPDWGHLSALHRFALRNLFAAATVGAELHLLWDRRPAGGRAAVSATFRPAAHHVDRAEPADWAKARRYADQITFEGFDPDAPA